MTPEAGNAGPSPARASCISGVAYWRDGEDRRLLIGTGDNRLIALDALTGVPVKTFGVNGEVDLGSVGLQRELPDDPVNLFACTSPPTICRDVVIIGQYIHDRGVKALMPPGDVRGFDVRTGALKWVFHTVPMKGEPGYETWLDGSAERNGNANIWAPMSADDDLGLVYLPGSCPTNNFFGGARPGDNLYGNALIALDVTTGERRWHFQFVHHDVWDFDLPCAPNLVDVTVDGRRIKAVAQVTKQGWCFVFDRVTGEPVWPIEERPVPQSPLTGERTAATQPFPTKPAPFEPQGVTEDMLIDFTPALNAEAKTLLAKYRIGPIYTPYTKTPTIQRPGWLGGANWAGAAVDPETGVLYVPSLSSVMALALDDDGKAIKGEAESEEIAGLSRLVPGPQGLPMFKPPYSRITAIDLNTGEHLWMKPNGPGLSRAPALKSLNLGWVGSTGRSGPLLTRTLLFQGEGPHDRRFGMKVLRAWDKATGAVIAEISLPDAPFGPPMTYMAGGRQFIVCGMGYRTLPHRLVALALP
jgi:quinoprotein glucose dehydrogenase